MDISKSKIVTEERQQWLRTLYFSNSNSLKKERENISIQDICFLIQSSKLDTELEKLLYQKIKDSNDICLLIDTLTNTPFVDADNHAEIFSSLEFASAAADYFEEQYKNLKIVSFDSTEDMFESLYRDGFSEALLDNGFYHTCIPITSIISLDKINSKAPAVNRELRFSALSLFQEITWEVEYIERKTVLQNKEKEMLSNLANAQLYVPIMQDEKLIKNITTQNTIEIDEGYHINILYVVHPENQRKYLPGFTTISEMTKLYDTDDTAVLLLSLDIIAALASENSDGFVLDWNTTNFIMSNENLNSIVNLYKK